MWGACIGIKDVLSAARILRNGMGNYILAKTANRFCRKWRPLSVTKWQRICEWKQFFSLISVLFVTFTEKKRLTNFVIYKSLKYALWSMTNMCINTDIIGSLNAWLHNVKRFNTCGISNSETNLCSGGWNMWTWNCYLWQRWITPHEINRKEGQWSVFSYSITCNLFLFSEKSQEYNSIHFSQELHFYMTHISIIFQFHYGWHYLDI